MVSVFVLGVLFRVVVLCFIWVLIFNVGCLPWLMFCGLWYLVHCLFGYLCWFMYDGCKLGV